MKYSLSNICSYVKGKTEVNKLTKENYISTENMIPNRGGICQANALPTLEYTQEYRRGDILVSNIRPYFKKIWYAETDGGCSNDVLVLRAKNGIDSKYQVIDRIDRSLLNISKMCPALSNTFSINDFSCEKSRLLYCESKDRRGELISIFSILKKQDYIEVVISKQDDNSIYRLTFNGWQHIAKLQQEKNIERQGFIAMSFDKEVEYIQDIFKQAIRVAGYEPQIIKDKEHNNYIMPEIFYEIEKSKFVVVDITKQNYGAYYEAGYAQALGKEVIVCCKKEVFDNPDTKPHFDIAQKSMILWKDEQDLLNRLVRRIEATVK